MPVQIERFNPHFKYTQLDVKRRQIRLLTLTNVTAAGLICCKLETASLDTQPDFIALSYVWGDERPKHILSIDGVEFSIRANLYNFLTTVAAQDYLNHAFFIDAICINQNDVRERGEQVSLMRDIYVQASQVICWLGIPWLSSPYPMTLVMKLLPVILNSFTSKKRLTNIDDDDDEIDSFAGVPELIWISQQPYWTRLWIVQEILLARSLHMYLGRTRLELEQVCASFKIFTFDDERLSTTMASILQILDSRMQEMTGISRGFLILSEKLDPKRRSQREGRPDRLYELLIIFAGQKCKDPRDIVFGLLGLAESHIVPDYNVSVTQLYLHVVIEGLLDIAATARTKDEAYELRWKFFHACFKAFNYPATQTTVRLVNFTMFWRYGTRPPPHYFPVEYMDEIVLQRASIANWPSGVKAIVSLYHMWRKLTIGWLPSLTLPQSYIYIQAIVYYLTQTLIMEFLEKYDCEMAMPDGEAYTYSGWVDQVTTVAEKVKKGVPAEPMKVETGMGSARGFERWYRWMDYRNFINLRNFEFTLLLLVEICAPLCVVYLGAKLGGWLNGQSWLFWGAAPERM